MDEIVNIIPVTNLFAIAILKVKIILLKPKAKSTSLKLRIIYSIITERITKAKEMNIVLYFCHCFSLFLFLLKHFAELI